MWRKLLNVIFPNPSMCVLCEKRTETLTVCEACLTRWRRFAELEGQCRRCGHFGSRAPVCDTCRDWPAYYLGNTAFLPYTDTVREAILRFKYHGEPWRAEGFGVLAAYWPAPLVDAIVPVPLHKARLRERGYKSVKCGCEPALGARAEPRLAAAIARRLAAACGQHASPGWAIEDGAYAKRGSGFCRA